MKAELSSGPDSAAQGLILTVLEGRLAVCRLDAGAEIPTWATGPPFFSVTRTEDELSVVCPEEEVPENVSQEQGWPVSAPLAGAGVSIFAVSTFDTDYVLVREGQLGLAVEALREYGHEVRGGAPECG